MVALLPSAGVMAVLKGTPTTYNKDFQVRAAPAC